MDGIDERVKAAIVGTGVHSWGQRLTSQYNLLYAAGLRASAVQLGLLNSIAGAVGSLASVPLGWATERYSVRRVLLLGYGLITASLVKSSGAATGLSFVFILPQMLRGTFVPVSQAIARFVPSYYVTDALTSLFLWGAPLTSPVIMYDLAVVAVVGVVTVVVGIAVFQRFGKG